MKRSRTTLTVLTLFSLTRLAACDTKAVVETENHPPAAPEVRIGPLDPTTTDDLVAVIATEARDADGDPITYSYRWFQDGLPRDELTNDTVPASETTRDETWEVSVTPNDGQADGTSASAKVVIEDSAPVITVRITPAEPTGADDLDAVVDVEDADGDPVDVAYLWERNGENAGQTASTVPASETERDDVWTVYAFDAVNGSGGQMAEASVTVANTPPEVRTVTLAPSLVYTDDTLTASVAAGDADGDPLGYSYTWYVDGVPHTGTANLRGAQYFDKGQEIYVVVTADDGWDTSAELASSPVTVQDTAPTAPVAQITPSSPGYQDDLTCDLAVESADADGDTIRYSFSWTVDGAPYTAAIDTATTSTVPYAAVSANDIWECTVEATAGGQTVSSSDSVRVTYTEACDGVDNDGDGSIDEGSVCPCSTYTYRSHGYMVCSSSTTYTTAKSYCETYGYHTLKLESAAEEAYVSGVASYNYWVGLEEGSTADHFTWSDGTAATYTNWDASYSQPDSGAGESCVQARSSGWHDVVCWTTSYVVCESDG